MSVYVDNALHPYGRMLMSHMIADTPAELLAMADKIGVARKWLQHRGTAKEHFDICKAKREAAIAEGALPLSSRELVKIIRFRRRIAEHYRTHKGKAEG